ncbi:MAG: LUD domain-containing protein, partial [Planctomycetota bacterium]|jgi:L-lactate dehydrogenase complex protein LldF
VETDLGEFIIQLAKQPPSHIVLPAVHLSAGDVFQIFKDKIGYQGSPDAHSMTRAARKHLRSRFGDADMGISGVNFGAAEQGLWMVCTNEGNGRYVMGMPRVYTAIMGIERLMQDVDSAAVILKMLARFATGQRITQYTNLVSGPGRGEGPEHVHLVLLDNGRSKILETHYWPMLRCIRCGACLNVCPVFKFIGGQSYPGTYSGPMGTVLLPLQKGLAEAGAPAKACSLCRICDEVCPVKIPLTGLLTELRSDMVEARLTPFSERAAMALGAWILRHPKLYRLGQKVMYRGLKFMSRAGWVKWLPSLGGRWSGVKDLPMPAATSYLADVIQKGREEPGRGDDE